MQETIAAADPEEAITPPALPKPRTASAVAVKLLLVVCGVIEIVWIGFLGWLIHTW
jgi:hypothetical protein